MDKIMQTSHVNIGTAKTVPYLTLARITLHTQTKNDSKLVIFAKANSIKTLTFHYS